MFKKILDAWPGLVSYEECNIQTNGRILSNLAQPSTKKEEEKLIYEQVTGDIHYSLHSSYCALCQALCWELRGLQNEEKRFFSLEELTT